jgi:hypothetical protein
MAGVSNKLLPDDTGIHLCFINHSKSYQNLSAVQVQNVMRRVSPSGSTPLGTVLKSKILEPLIYPVLAHPGGRQLKRQLLVYIITDGCPTKEEPNTFEEAILLCRRRLAHAGYDVNTVVFMISQIGQDDHAEKFIQSLRGDSRLQDVVYCVSDKLDGGLEEVQSEEKMEEWLLSILTRPLMTEEL